MKSIYSLPEWTDIQKQTYDLFFMDLQEINIYVEDENSEIFYMELFKDLLDPQINIKKILPLNGRENVIKYCEIYSEQKPAIFLIDADLYWVRGDNQNKTIRLYQHDRYCIENYLFSENAIIEIIFETVANKTKDEIKHDLLWYKVEENIKDTLIDLFIQFAIIHKFEKSVTTVKTGIKECFASHKQDEYEISKENVEKLMATKQLEIVKKSIHKNYSKQSEIYKKIKQEVIDNVDDLSEKIHIISGKHFLIHILYRIMKKHTSNAQMTMDSFKLRLARHCDKNALLPLKIAIENTVNGIDYKCP